MIYNRGLAADPFHIVLPRGGDVALRMATANLLHALDVPSTQPQSSRFAGAVAVSDGPTGAPLESFHADLVGADLHSLPRAAHVHDEAADVSVSWSSPDLRVTFDTPTRHHELHAVLLSSGQAAFARAVEDARTGAGISLAAGSTSAVATAAGVHDIVASVVATMLPQMPGDWLGLEKAAALLDLADDLTDAGVASMPADELARLRAAAHGWTGSAPDLLHLVAVRELALV
jgi:hypothetical protein